MCNAYINWFKEEGGNISVDLSLFASLYITNFIIKLKLIDFLNTKKPKTKINSLTVNKFF